MLTYADVCSSDIEIRGSELFPDILPLSDEIERDLFEQIPVLDKALVELFGHDSFAEYSIPVVEPFSSSVPLGG
jgi:hypothetical protein